MKNLKLFERDKPCVTVCTIGDEDLCTKLTSRITHILSKKGQAEFVPLEKLGKRYSQPVVVCYQTDNFYYTHLNCATSKIAKSIACILQSDLVALIKSDNEDFALYESLLQTFGKQQKKSGIYHSSQVKGALEKGPEIEFDNLLLQWGQALVGIKRDDESDFMMVVNQVYGIDVGVVVSGIIIKGKISLGKPVKVWRRDKSTLHTTATSIHMFNSIAQQASAGDYANILLRGIHRKEVKRGNYIFCGKIPSKKEFIVSVQDVNDGTYWYYHHDLQPVLIHHYGVAIQGYIYKEKKTIHLQLEHAAPLAPGDRVVLGHGNGYLLAEIE